MRRHFLESVVKIDDFNAIHFLTNDKRADQRGHVVEIDQATRQIPQVQIIWIVPIFHDIPWHAQQFLLGDPHA